MSLRVLIPVVFLSLAVSCSASSGGEERVIRELDRLGAAHDKLQAAALPEMLRGAVAPARDALAAARNAQDPSLQLYRLRRAFIDIETLSFVSSHAAAGESIDALAKLWQERASTFAAPAGARRSLLQSSLAEAAWNRGARLYRASLPYGRVSGALSGLYYLGEAEANAAFARFVSSLPAHGREEDAPDAAALEEALTALQSELLTVFEQDPAGRAAVPASARLKEARELLEGGSRSAATLLLLEARLELSRAARGAATAAANVPLRQDGPLDSMAALWRAMSDDALVRRDVLPLYADLRRPR